MNIKKLGFGFFSIGVALFASTAVGHDINNKSLLDGNGPEATDVWQTECMGSAILGNSARLVANITQKFTPNDLSKLTLVVYKDGKAQNTVDLTGGDDAGSPLISVDAGNGIYTMIASRTAGGNKIYSIEFHCENEGGDHTPTTVPSIPVQDQ